MTTRIARLVFGRTNEDSDFNSETRYTRRSFSGRGVLTTSPESISLPLPLLSALPSLGYKTLSRVTLRSKTKKSRDAFRFPRTISFSETGTDPRIIRDNANRDAKERDSDYILGYLRVYVFVHARAMMCAFQLPTTSAVKLNLCSSRYTP